MDEEKQQDQNLQVNEEKEEEIKPAARYIKIKPFPLIMIVFGTIILTAAITIFALTFGDEKVVEVSVPVERKEFQELYKVYDELKNKYYVDIDDEKAIQGAINGMLDSLDDPYSDYLNVDEATQFNEDLSSSFQGIGAEIQTRNGNIVVISPIKNSPAEKAGILPEDIIVSVDGKKLEGMSASEAVLLIRGKKGTSVKLAIKRAGHDELIEMNIVRDDIPIETVYGEMGQDKIAHIQITSFSENTYDELAKILKQYETEGMKSIILDLRQNPGGYLDQAIDIANLFVDSGKPIVQVQTKNGEPTVYNAKGGKKYKLPIAVLIDNGSASASEILAGALSESSNATLIGLTSFGKGTVQTVSSLEDGANLKYTSGKWLTPNGNWINEKGIKPNIEVKYPEYASLPYIDPNTELKVGTNSNVVNAAEKMLDALGYNVGKVDNEFDYSTYYAVKRFQGNNGLEKTGILKGDTTYKLMESLKDKIKKEDPQLLKAKEILSK